MKKSGKELFVYLLGLAAALLLLALTCLYYFNKSEIGIFKTMSIVVFADLGFVLICSALALIFGKRRKY